MDGLDQAVPRGPFAWQLRPDVKVLGWKSSAARDVLVADCVYLHFRHEHRIVFDKSGSWIVVIDRLEGPPGEHRVEQFWHFGVPVRQSLLNCFQLGTKALIAFDGAAKPRLFEGEDYGWTSPAVLNGTRRCPRRL